MEDRHDYFDILGLERKAALSEDEVKEAFHEASRRAHPDVRGDGGEDGAFDVVNEAQRCLSDPGSRLVHFVELESGEPPPKRDNAAIDGDLMDLFARAGGAMQAADTVLRKKEEAVTALGRAVLAGEEMASQEKLRAIAGEIFAALNEAGARLPEIDARLATDRDGALEEARALARRFRFLSKWQAKTREKIAAFI